MGLDMKTAQENGRLTHEEVMRARGYPPRRLPHSLIVSENIIAEEHAEVERIARECRL